MNVCPPYTVETQASGERLVRSPNGTVAAVLDDSREAYPRSADDLQRDAEVIARALTDAATIRRLQAMQAPTL